MIHGARGTYWTTTISTTGPAFPTSTPDIGFQRLLITFSRRISWGFAGRISRKSCWGSRWQHYFRFLRATPIVRWRLRFFLLASSTTFPATSRSPAGIRGLPALALTSKCDNTVPKSAREDPQLARPSDDSSRERSFATSRTSGAWNCWATGDLVTNDGERLWE